MEEEAATERKQQIDEESNQRQNLVDEESVFAMELDKEAARLKNKYMEQVAAQRAVDAAAATAATKIRREQEEEVKKLAKEAAKKKSEIDLVARQKQEREQEHAFQSRSLISEESLARKILGFAQVNEAGALAKTEAETRSKLSIKLADVAAKKKAYAAKKKAEDEALKKKVIIGAVIAAVAAGVVSLFLLKSNKEINKK